MYLKEKDIDPKIKNKVDIFRFYIFILQSFSQKFLPKKFPVMKLF